VFVTLTSEEADGREVAHGFAVASNRTKNAYLSIFSFSDLILYVRGLARDDVVSKRLLRDGCGNMVEVGSSKTLTDEEFEAFFLQHGRRRRAEDILDFLAGGAD
jgi:hypothetical protein